MRKALNENPIVQIMAVGVLAVIVGFLLLTRVMNRDSGAEPAASTTATPTATTAAPTDTATTAPAAGTETTPASPSEVVPTAPADSATAPASTDGFTAGPGLPKPVVSAYENGDTVALFVYRRGGLDDTALASSIVRLRGVNGVAVFTTRAKGVARYSRIVGGVDLDRPPALVVVTPRSVSAGGLPSASVSYGFRDFESVAQAVHDAGYDGKDLPYYPK
jgi:hypothetical protein